MARYQVILAYDGTLFAGFQRQARTRTVQGEVEAALKRLGWQGRAIQAAGRTDTGVHASGNVIAFDLEWKHPIAELLQALNALLPGDVAAQAVHETDAGFHPRFDAQARLYRYRLSCQPVRNPLIERYAWRVWPEVELGRLKAAAQVFLGTHDFCAFGAPTRPGSSTVRAVYASDWQAHEAGELYYEIQGNAFLYHMVRRIVFLQVLVGLGRLEPEALESGVLRGTTQTPGMAPAQGLTLVEVTYASQAEPVKTGNVSNEDPDGLCA
jgi:tRNA pseudouridine38-40 synthase